MIDSIFSEIGRADTAQAVFELMNDYFGGQGFGGMCYVAPETITGPYTLLERGMPTEWIHRYRTHSLDRIDPIPGLSFRLGHPERIDDLIRRAANLSVDEREFLAAFQTTGLTNSLVVPTYGPFGRPGMIGLGQIAHPDLFDEIDLSLVSAVAQQIHIRMELLQCAEPPPGLSPREREVLRWLVKGKSQGDIAAILSISEPTVATHIKRLYHKLGVQDRVSAVTKAVARHYDQP